MALRALFSLVALPGWRRSAIPANICGCASCSGVAYADPRLSYPEQLYGHRHAWRHVHRRVLIFVGLMAGLVLLVRNTVGWPLVMVAPR